MQCFEQGSSLLAVVGLAWGQCPLRDQPQSVDAWPRFFGAGGMLAGFDDGAVNEGFLKIGIYSKFGKYQRPIAAPVLFTHALQVTPTPLLSEE